MKKLTSTIKLPAICLAITLMAPTAILANEGRDTAVTDNIQQVEKAINKALSKAVVYPVQAKEQDLIGSVLVHFTLDEDGRLQLITSNSQNKELLTYVKRKLETVTISDVSPDLVDRILSINIVFKEEGSA